MMDENATLEQNVNQQQNLDTNNSIEMKGKNCVAQLQKILQFLTNFFESNPIIIISMILTALTGFGEELLEVHFYECPKDLIVAEEYVLYYVFGLTALLWLIGILVYSPLWRICQGYPEDKCTCYGYVRYIALFVEVIRKTLLIPAAWIFFVLMDGDYLACIETANPGSDEYNYWKTRSRIYGFWFLFAILLASIICRLLYQWCIKTSYWLHEYTIAYLEAEEKELSRYIDENSKKLAKNRVDAFTREGGFQKREQCEEISKIFLPPTDSLILSSLHKVVVDNNWDVRDVEPPNKLITN